MWREFWSFLCVNRDSSFVDCYNFYFYSRFEERKPFTALKADRICYVWQLLTLVSWDAHYTVRTLTQNGDFLVLFVQVTEVAKCLVECRLSYRRLNDYKAFGKKIFELRFSADNKRECRPRKSTYELKYTIAYHYMFGSKCKYRLHEGSPNKRNVTENWFSQEMHLEAGKRP